MSGSFASTQRISFGITQMKVVSGSAIYLPTDYMENQVKNKLIKKEIVFLQITMYMVHP